MITLGWFSWSLPPLRICFKVCFAVKRNLGKHAVKRFENVELLCSYCGDFMIRKFFSDRVYLSQDNTSPDDKIQIQLVSVPMYGILTRSQSQQEHQELREYSSFTMEDINKHRIR